MRERRVLLFAGLVFLTAVTAKAGLVTIDFEGQPDFTPVAALYAAQGITFSSGSIGVSAAFGGTLNEVDFPPMVPGQAVFLNEADTTILLFLQPILSFSGFFTYGGPLTLNFYAAGDVLLGSLSSTFQTNVGTGGDPGSSPNELISAPALADSVRIDILAPGTGFSMDDLSFITTGDEVSVPEPGTGILISAVGAILFLARRFGPR